MKTNKTESNRTFVPKKIGETLSKVNKSILANMGKMSSSLYQNGLKSWVHFLLIIKEPDKISRVTEEFNELNEPIFKNFLHVKVSPAAAVEFQHYKDTIIEKINSFFGYKAIADLRLQQNLFQKQKLIVNSMMGKLTLKR